MKQNLLTTLLITALFILSNNAFAQLTITETHQDCPCYGDAYGSIDITVTGGTTPYTYNWETTNGSGLVATDEDQTELTAGDYNCTVTDDASNEEYISVTISEPSELDISITNIIPATCYGYCDGIAYNTTVGGTPPYYYNWSTGPSVDSSHFNLCAGSVFVTVTDYNGCYTGVAFTITEPIQVMQDYLSINYAESGVCNGSIDIYAYGGSGIYGYLWDTGDTTNLLSNLCAGTYSLTVTDVNNCTSIGLYNTEEIYDTVYTTFVDTVTIVIDTCLFNTSIPIDSASIYDFEIISVDSAITNWVFWQAGTAIYLDVTVSYTSGTNLIYLQIVCLNKATTIYKFYGVFNSTAVGVQEVRILPNFKLYPNPATHNVQITINNEQLGSTLQIINVSGEVVKQFKVQNSEFNIDLSTEAKGIYFVKLIGEGFVSTQKVVLE